MEWLWYFAADNIGGISYITRISTRLLWLNRISANIGLKRDRVARVGNVFDSVYYFDDIVFGRSFRRINAKFRSMAGDFLDYLVDAANLFI